MKKQQYAYTIQVAQLQSVIENNKKEMMDLVVQHNQECETLRFIIEKQKTEAKEMSLQHEEERKTLEGHILRLKQQLSEAEDQSTKKLQDQSKINQTKTDELITQFNDYTVQL